MRSTNLSLLILRTKTFVSKAKKPELHHIDPFWINSISTHAQVVDMNDVF